MERKRRRDVGGFRALLILIRCAASDGHHGDLVHFFIADRKDELAQRKTFQKCVASTHSFVFGTNLLGA